MKTFKLKYSFPLLFLFLLFNLFSSLSAWTSSVGDDAPDNSAVELDIDNDFHLLFGGQTNQIYGDMAATGDTILNVPDADYTALYDVNSTYMLTDTNNTFQNAPDPRKRNSSQGSLNLPSYVEGKDITFAGLFWQGFIHEDGIATTEDVDAAVSGWNKVTFKTPDGIEHSITASTSTKDVTNKTYHYAYKDSNSFHFHYSAYVDVTSMVKTTYSSSTDTFTLGNVLTTAGKDWGDNMYFSYGLGGDGTGTGTNDGNWGSARMGYYSGWALIVVYAVDPATATANSVDYKTVSIFDGFDQFLIWDENQQLLIDIDINNFLTPKEGDLDSKLLLFGGAGDYGIANDVLQIYNPDTTSFETISNATNPVGQQFNSSYTNIGTHMTSKHIRNGVDLDIFDVSSHMAHKQTSTKIKFGVERQTGSADQIFPQVLAFSTKLYEPEFCYDYAYKQQGRYFTEPNDGSKDPELVGDVVIGEPVEMTIFIRNLVASDITVSNMTVNVLDINDSQVTYVRETTKLADTGDIIANSIPDSDLTVDDTYIKDIDIGDGIINANEFFYIYYSLDPKTTDLNTSITVRAEYTITVDGSDIDYSLQLGAKISLCNSDNFIYTPTAGRLNVVHNNYYTYDLNNTNGNKYYNIPTQVTKREGNFKVLSMKSTDYDELSANHGALFVEVEMIDAAAFHQTDISCYEEESSISEKVTVVFDANTTSVPFDKDALLNAIALERTNLSTSSEFYKTARENAAFRVTYYEIDDENATLPDYYKDGNEYNATWTMNWQGENCVVDMDVDGFMPINNTDDTVMNFCQGGSGMTELQAIACLKCVYGDKRKQVCSRDNFAIRPEAFMLKLNDQEQHPTVPTTTIVRFADDRSGVDTSNLSIDQVELAAGYQYKLEVNATNHLGNDSSLGYTKTFGVDSNDTTEYQWPTSGAPIGCNDERNSTISFKILDGAIDLNTSLDQVGVYRLHMHDETWTSVDHDPAFMTHHDDSTYFDLDNPDDCIVGNSTTQVINSNNKNGCNISSNHSASATTLEYRDYDVEFHPYKFDLTTITPTTGLNHSAVTATSFVYMTDMNFNSGQDENMSYHLNGFIKAYGENNSTLDNFVTNCYAKPLEIDVDKSTINLPVAYQYRFHSLDENGSNLRTDNADLNNSGNVISVLATDFPKLLDGAADTIFNLNYNRTNNAPMNPEVVAFNRYDVDCSAAIVATECTFQADLTSAKTSIGSKDLNSSISINHYYGRTHAPRNRFVGAVGNAFIYYEVFCNGITGGTTCDKTLLQNGLNSRVTDDPRWFRNEAHTVLNDGRAGLIDGSDITQKNATRVTTGALTEIAGRTTTPLTYDTSRGYPYKATMEDNASRWLFYNQYSSDQNESRNEFEVEFVSDTSNWAGKAESTSTTGEVGSKKTNRRSMW